MSHFYLASVCDNKDPLHLGRIQVELALNGVPTKSDWLPLMTVQSGKGTGVWFVPELHDQVLVMFYDDHMQHGFVMGSLWNQKTKPPLGGQPTKKIIKTKSGSTLVFDDTKGKEQIFLATKDEKCSITFDQKEKAITLKTEKAINITAKKGVFIKAETVSITAKKTAGFKVASFEAKTSSKGISFKAGQGILAKGSSISLN